MSTQFIILLLAMGVSFASWFFGKLREQAEVKAQQEAARKRREQALREAPKPTSRASAQPEPTPVRQGGLDDLAARRQRQLQELRKRQAERARTSTSRGVERTEVRAPQQQPTARQRPAPARQRGGAKPPAQPGAAPTRRGPFRSREEDPRRTLDRTRKQAETLHLQGMRELEQERQRQIEQARSRPALSERRSMLGTLRSEAVEERRVASVAHDVRSLLGEGGEIPTDRKRRLRALIASSEVLGQPVSMRSG